MFASIVEARVHGADESFDASGGGPMRRSAWLSCSVIPHEPSVRRALSRLGVREDAIEDVLQDAYLRLLKAEDVSNVRDSRSYFARAARSVVLSRARRAKVLVEETRDDHYFSTLEAAEPGPEAAIDAHRQWAKVQSAFEDLGDRRRQVVVLRRFERLSGRETAARMAISESAVEKHLGAAMRHLRSALADLEPPVQDG